MIHIVLVVDCMEYLQTIIKLDLKLQEVLVTHMVGMEVLVMVDLLILLMEVEVEVVIMEVEQMLVIMWVMTRKEEVVVLHM